jgi:hypothetical protein
MSRSSRDAKPAFRFSRKTFGIFSAVALVTVQTGGSAPTPLYRLYQEAWSLSSVQLTVIFAIYALSLLGALLVIGSLSDYVGRKPVILGALILAACSMIVFIEARSVSWLIGARILQGLATGAAASSIGAAILDTNREHGAILNSVMSFLGTTLGALGGAVLVTYAPAPTELVYALLCAAFLVLAMFVGWMPETATTRSGVLASLVPHIAIPSQAKSTFLAITPANVAGWALGGFYLSLMPSMQTAAGVRSYLVGGLVVAALTLSGGVAILLWRHWPAQKALRAGAVTLIVGVAVTLAGVHWQSVALLGIGTLVAGFGFGAGFAAAARALLPKAETHQRAGLLSAFYVESYLAFSLPAICVGMAVPAFGLVDSTYGYGTAVIILSLASLLAGSKR